MPTSRSDTTQMSTQRKKAELLFLLYYCCCRRRHVVETPCFVVKYLVWASKRGHNYKSVVKLYLQHCSGTVQPKYYSVCSAFYGGLFPEPVSSLPSVHKGCFYKVGQFQLYKDSLVLSTQVSMFSYLKNLPLTIQTDVSFEQCRIVLVACHFSDHKCRHGNVYALRKKTV